MITAQQIFDNFVEENGRIPSFDEFKALGYGQTTYYKCRKDHGLTREQIVERDKIERVKANQRKELRERRQQVIGY